MIKKIKDQLKKGALSFNGYSNISSLTGETESQSTASDNIFDDASNRTFEIASDNDSGTSGNAENASMNVIPPTIMLPNMITLPKKN